MDKINDQDDDMWEFKKIVAHEGPLLPSYPNYKGSLYNVTI